MTDGRFEAVNSIRPNNWDQRRLWCERPQFIRLDPEIRYDESCPFHDLKADGCFQPEYGLIHDNERATTPNGLVRRPDGGMMKSGRPHPKNMGMGGRLLPLDSTPANPPPAAKHSGKPWATGSRMGLFSTPEYIATPAAPPPPPAPAPLVAPPPYTKKIKLGAPVPYMPDNKKPLPGPINCCFKAGKYKPRPLTAVLPDLPPKKETPQKVKPPIQRKPYKDGKSLQGTFGPNAPHLPTPYTDGPLESRKGGPIFTYWAHSKREAPIQCPWSTLPQTADPIQGYKTTGTINPIQTRGTQ